MDHCVVGVQILHQLVLEMNQAESMRSLAKHRKVASSFRDESLFDIFTLSCTLLRQINVRDETQVWASHSSLFSSACSLFAGVVCCVVYSDHSLPLQSSLISWLLKLSCACLSFDFIGTSTDESADDLSTVQIPTSWRSVFLDNLTLQLYFDLFHNLSSELAAMVCCVCS